MSENDTNYQFNFGDANRSQDNENNGSYDPLQEIDIDKETEQLVEDFMEDLAQEEPYDSQPQVKTINSLVLYFQNQLIVSSHKHTNTHINHLHSFTFNKKHLFNF